MRLNLDSHCICRVPLEEADPLPPEDARVPARAGGLEMLYRMHRDRLLRFLERRGTPDQAADIVQRLFARLARTDVAPRPAIDAPDAYLRQAAHNLLRDDARAAERRSAHLHICLDDVTLVAPDPIAALEARDMLQRLEAAVAGLQPRTREIFLAHRVDGYSYGEIAFRTGLSVKTVEKHMSRAIARLGRQLGR
ncbi:sigma-70 family RNA polymerase sigma factor [Sphingomonas suaedae]|uniref:Sigma-70 family RNA polymerase sigma factor n=1 Tax=Sphingomonas suaedae TaxID=2599297 RepID=A0A518RCH1_9SPHN|nr:sigma-70 family RNA polymerase sigma factor [Sphingomonas suaedae]QDX25153.1 sigma-70 family RNA polymerase sigma factor [Sphingomonas suaedae]